MKLLIATPLYPPDHGGPATYAKLLNDHLSEEGSSVVLVKFSEVRNLPKVVRHIAYFWKVYTAGKSADIFLALDPVSTGLPALFAARLLGKPFVVKIVGDFAWEQGTQRFGIVATLDTFVRQERVPFAVGCLRAVQTFVAKSASKIIVPSDYLQTIVTAWSKKIIPENISVIYNSVALPEITEAILPADTSGTVIVSAGRLVPWKGMEGLIEAVQELQKSVPDVSLVIVGDGPDRISLEEKGRKLLGSAVSFTGALSHLETLKTMQSATIYVQNSSYEGLSHQLIETLMLGKTIIATNAGGNPELIEDGVNGVLVAFGDKAGLVEALQMLVGDRELRARLAAHAKESSSRFALPIMIEKTRSVLSSVIQESI